MAGWDLATSSGRDGAFRNLLRTVHDSVDARAREFADGSSGGGDLSDRLGVVTDLLYLMIHEHAVYRHNLRASLGAYEAATDQGQAMMIDNRELMAEHLAAARAEARMMLQPVPHAWPDVDEKWMETTKNLR